MKTKTLNSVLPGPAAVPLPSFLIPKPAAGSGLVLRSVPAVRPAIAGTHEGEDLPQPAGSSAPACPGFDVWWHNEGSGIVPRQDDDMESHAKRVAEIAWQNGAYKAQYPTRPNDKLAGRRKRDE